MTHYTRALADPALAAEAGSPIRFVASSHEAARDNFTIRQDRWTLDNFRRNPVVLFAHDYGRPPIGKGTPSVTERGLELDVTFDQGDPFARDIERKYRDGYMNAVSIGWDDVKAEGEAEPYHDLWEVSAVPVPSDPGALMDRQRSAVRALAFEMLRASVPDDPTPDDPGDPEADERATHKRPIVDGETVYEDFAACVLANQDKDDPEGYCGALEAAMDDGGGEDRTPDETGAERDVEALEANGGDGEGWDATATAMVEVYAPEPDDTDASRRQAYAALLPRYRRAGKTPPEWLTMSELDAIEVGSALWRALFLHDEVDRARTRVGQVLAKRNADRIRDARRLLQEVLDDARVTDDVPDDKPTEADKAEVKREPEVDEEYDTLATWRAALVPNVPDYVERWRTLTDN